MGFDPAAAHDEMPAAPGRLPRIFQPLKSLFRQKKWRKMRGPEIEMAN
jgi:hypothetical protein